MNVIRSEGHSGSERFRVVTMATVSRVDMISILVAVSTQACCTTLPRRISGRHVQEVHKVIRAVLGRVHELGAEVIKSFQSKHASALVCHI